MSKQQNISEHQEELDENYEVLICTQCGQQVDNILGLQCKHDLCLDCATKNINPFDQIKVSDYKIQCEICSLVTKIDPNSYKELQNYAKKNYMSQQQLQGSTSKLTSNAYKQNAHFIQQQKFLDKDFSSNFQQQNNSLKKNFEEDESKYLSHFCRDHVTEEAQLFCFTCLTNCICVDCYINGSHKNHDVRNVKKSIQNLQQMVQELTYKLKAQTDFLYEDELKLQQKKKELVETITDAKQKINSQFEDLFEKIEKKQQNMLSNLDEFLEEKFTEIDLTLSKVKHQLEILHQNEEQLNSFCVFEENQVSHKDEIIGFNYYAENKASINQLLNKIETNLFDQIQPKLNQRFCLDLQSAHFFVQQIRDIKVEILAVRGIESNVPTTKEQYYFELAKEDKLKQKFFHLNASNLSRGRGSPLPQKSNYKLQTDQQLQQQITSFDQPINLNNTNFTTKQDEDLVNASNSKINDSKIYNSWISKYERLFKKQ